MKIDKDLRIIYYTWTLLVAFIITLSLIPTLSSEDEGPNSPGTVVNDDRLGLILWVDPDYAKASDDNYATAYKAPPATRTTYWLKATNFSFSIPTGKQIDGILVEVERKASDSDVVSDTKIVKPDDSIGTYDTDHYDWLTTESYVSLGGAEELWGESWTAEDINNATFGVAIIASIPGGRTIYVDHIRMTVYYSEAPTDTCTCPGAGEDWEINMSDYCNITEACDLTTGTLNFTGTGWCKCNASVDTTNLGDPGANGILYIQDSCEITIN